MLASCEAPALCRLATCGSPPLACTCPVAVLTLTIKSIKDISPLLAFPLMLLRPSGLSGALHPSGNAEDLHLATLTNPVRAANDLRHGRAITSATVHESVHAHGGKPHDYKAPRRFSGHRCHRHHRRPHVALAAAWPPASMAATGGLADSPPWEATKQSRQALYTVVVKAG